MLNLPAHHHLLDAFVVADVDQLTERTQGYPMATRGQGFKFRGSFLFDTDGNYFESSFARCFECQYREAAIAGNEAVGLSPGRHGYLMKPRLDAAINRSSSSISGVVPTSA